MRVSWPYYVRPFLRHEYTRRARERTRARRDTRGGDTPVQYRTDPGGTRPRPPRGTTTERNDTVGTHTALDAAADQSDWLHQCQG